MGRIRYYHETLSISSRLLSVGLVSPTAFPFRSAKLRHFSMSRIVSILSRICPVSVSYRKRKATSEEMAQLRNNRCSRIVIITIRCSLKNSLQK